MSAPRFGQQSGLRSALRKLARLVDTDAEVRSTRPTGEDLEALRLTEPLGIALLARACERHASRVCFRTREHAITYAALWDRVVALASGLHHAELVRAGDLVGIRGFSSVDWIVADLACSYIGAICVPLQSGGEDSDLSHVVNETDLKVLFCTEDQRATVARVVGPGRTIVAMDLTGSTNDSWSIHDLESSGRASGAIPFAHPSPDAHFSIVYTSGSTGNPKGVILSQGRWATTLLDAIVKTPIPTITVGYLPLSHMAGRINIYITMMIGGVSWLIPNGDIATLFDEIRAARPTTMTLVPRVSGMIYQHFQSQLVKRAGALRTTSEILDDPISREIMGEMRATFLGDRLCFATTGAAPTPPEVLTFLERCFEIQIIDTYGSTELGRVTVNGRVQPWVSYKLIDVPELGYTTRDTPYPRGELAVKSTREGLGYFKDSDATGRRDAEGYFLSGDIVEERAPGHVVWIDRKHATLRLAQGEFVNVARLEDRIVAESSLIEQIFVHGSSLRSYVVAVVVPNRDALAVALGRIATDLTDRAADIKRLVRTEIDRVARAVGLAGHEVPRDFLVELQPFASEAGLLTETGKMRRAQLRSEYGLRLEQICSTIEERQFRAADLSPTATDAEQVVNAIAIALGLDSSEVVPAQQSFLRLGGDSFSAMRASTLIAETCGVAIPVASLLDPSATLSTVIRRVENARNATNERATFEQIHGKNAEWARARDLHVERFVPVELVRGARDLPISESARTVLLTGANGYLGRFILLELLERARSIDGTVVCVVRAADDDGAFRRVRAPFERSGELTNTFDELARSHLRVYAGDLSQANLGLPPQAFANLTDGVDAILHNGALVNHALSYPHLFGPNVAGTAELARLAITKRRKPIAFVSTTGVAAGIRRTTPIMETEEAGRLWSRRPVRAEQSDYALGYSTSKWACEVLLKTLHDACDVPVRIFRCGMILPHRIYSDQHNEGDAFIRLLYGITRTGVAPWSFYDTSTITQPHYDGLPVDFVAKAIAGIATSLTTSFGIYHVTNSNWSDGVSLDTVIEWALASDPSLARLPHTEWFVEFKRRLEMLNEAEKRRSPLAIVERWARPMGDESALQLDTSSFRTKLRELFTNDEIPKITESFVRRCLSALRGDPQQSSQ